MPEKGFRMLRHTRIFMFIAIGFYYITISQNLSFIKEMTLIFCTFVFIIDHFLLYNSSSHRKFLMLTLIDFLVATVIGFVYGVNSDLYLIYFNIIGVTLFFETSDKRVMRLFIFLFFFVWASIFTYRGISTNVWPLLADLMNVCFVMFGCIVGYLINKLMQAREEVAQQYDKLNDSHQALKDAHGQLSIYAKQVEQLTVIKERNRIARDIHDTVGHKMTALLIQLQLAKELVNQQKEEGGKTIETCETIAREALQEIRMSVQTLHAEDDESITFQDMIKSLLQKFSKIAHIETSLEIKGEQSYIPSSLEPTIKRVIQESLTNAVRHGEATRSTIHIQCSEEHITCHVFDNGKGNNAIQPGFGLVNMRERVMEHGGKLSVESSQGKGFSIIAEFPLKLQQWQTGGVL